jgi:hypothetical protein
MLRLPDFKTIGPWRWKCCQTFPAAFIHRKYSWYSFLFGARGGVVVKALRYKPAGRGFDSLWCRWNFSVT